MITATNRINYNNDSPNEIKIISKIEEFFVFDKLVEDTKKIAKFYNGDSKEISTTLAHRKVLLKQKKDDLFSEIPTFPFNFTDKITDKDFSMDLLNQSIGFEYCKKRADLGGKTAQYLLFFYYEREWGTTRDLDSSFKYCKLSADQGNRHAQFTLSKFYKYGLLCERDAFLSFEYCKKAADQGDAKAEFILSEYYKEGFGTPVDAIKSFEYCALSLKNGYARALLTLSRYYRDGFGTDVDKVLGIKYLYLWIDVKL